MKGIIDRFEEDYVIIELEDLTMINVEKFKLPYEAKEGDVIILEDQEITIDIEETKKRKEKISKLMNELFK